MAPPRLDHARPATFVLISPGRAEQRQQNVVEADEPGRLPRQHQKDRKDEQHRVRAGAAGEKEVHVEERPGRGRDPDEGTDDERDADRGLTECDRLAEPGVGVVVEKELEDAPIPVVGDRRLGRRGWDLRDVEPEAFQGQARIDPRRVLDLVKTSLDSGVSDVQANGEPDNGHARVAEEELCERGVLDDAPAREDVDHAAQRDL